MNASMETDDGIKGRCVWHRLAIVCALCLGECAPAAGDTDLTGVQLEQLLNMTVVSASKYAQSQREVAAAATVITRREIRAFGWRTLADALSSLPGIYSSYNRQNTIVGTRGFGLPGDFNTRLLLMIDGNRVNDPTYDSGRFGWDFPLDMDLIERIEFIPGPGGAVYGQNAMFGVVNVITRTGAGVGGAELAAAYQQPQSLREGRASFGELFDEGTDVIVSVSGLEARGQNLFFDFGSLPVAGVADGDDGQDDQHLLAHITHGPWSLEEIYGWGRKDDPTAAFFSTPLAPGESQAVGIGLTQLEYQNDVADALQLQARAVNGTSNAVYTGEFYGGYYHTQGQSRWRGGDLRLLWTSLARHELMFGVEGQDEPKIDQGVHGIGFVNPLDNFWIHSPGYRVALYAQDDWRIADTLSATLGLREDHNDVTGTKGSPRAALIWQALPTTTLKALYGIAHRAPNAYERDYGDGNSQIANPGLQGETIDTFELVADQRVGRDLALRASIYRWDMTGLITQVFDPASGIPPQYRSGEKVNAQGVEISADRTWDSGARLRGSVSVEDAAYASGRGLLNSPKRLGKLNLSAPLAVAGLRVGYELQYGSSRLTRDGLVLGGYGVSNLTLSTEALAPGLEVSLSSANVFDKRYAEPGAENNWQNSFEQDGRSVRLKLSQRF
jgi:iron complex outermembrane receptor protein